MVKTEELDTKINSLLKSKSKTKAAALIEKYKAADIAEALDDLDNAKDVYSLFGLFDDEAQAELITYLEVQDQEYIFHHLSEKDLSSLVNDIYSDDLVDIIDELPRKIVKRILTATTPEKRKELNSILKYDEETAGGIMSVNFLKFNEETTVSEAIKKIRDVHDNFETIDDIFIVNEFGNLVGEIKLKDLVINKPTTKLSSIMDTAIVTVDINQDQEEVVKLFKKYDVNTLPVIDETGKLTGIITNDDVIDVIEKEQTEDMQKVAGIIPLDDDSLFDIPTWKMILSRSLWLLVGILLATVTQILLVVFFNKYGVNGFLKDSSEQSKAYTAVFLLAPMALVIAAVCGIGINQTTTSMIRLLSLKSYDKKELWKIIGKETFVNLVLGIAIVVVNLIRLIIFYQVQDGHLKPNEWNAIATSSIALFVGVIISGFLGTLLPVAAKKLDMDPALVSSPLTTGIVDIITVAIFFGIGLAF